MEIAAIAARQHGVIEHSQLTALGLSRQAINRRVHVGRLHRIHQGVYAVGHKRLTQRGRWMAAVLAGGAGAVLSHRSAAALWQLLPAGRIHVTTPRRLHNRHGIEFHSQSLQFDEVAIRDGIPTTTVARTLIDIAATEPRRFEPAFNEAEYRRLYDETGVLAILGRNPSRRGAATIRTMVGNGYAGITREELELRFLDLIEDYGLPHPERNVDLELVPGRWIRVDCVWRQARLIVELDGRAGHDTASRFDSDRERDRLLTLAGWTVVRATWRHVTAGRHHLAADLRELIAARR